jgi:hypothetical protein
MTLLLIGMTMGNGATDTADPTPSLAEPAAA